MIIEQILERPKRERARDMPAWRRLRVQGCETCEGREAITAMASDGASMSIPCPCCAANDAPGG